MFLRRTGVNFCKKKSKPPQNALLVINGVITPAYKFFYRLVTGAFITTINLELFCPYLKLVQTGPTWCSSRDSLLWTLSFTLAFNLSISLTTSRCGVFFRWNFLAVQMQWFRFKRGDFCLYTMVHSPKTDMMENNKHSSRCASDKKWWFSS